jgi:hypothetical protein
MELLELSILKNKIEQVIVGDKVLVSPLNMPTGSINQCK